jgi:dienelactone hydrolase
MAEILIFHHAQGLTAGVLAFAQTLRDAGHTVHTPDLYEGHTFDDLDEGVSFASSTGFDTILERGRQSAESLPDDLVYAGLSLGVMPAQLLAQTRPGAKGALLLHGCIWVNEFGEKWPDGVPVQIHAMDADPWFTEEGGDLDAARALVATTPEAELFLYPGDRHLFTDSSLPAFDPAASALLRGRVLQFLS